MKWLIGTAGLLGAAAAGCSVSYGQQTRVRRFLQSQTGLARFELEGTCDSDAEVRAEITGQIQDKCGSQEWVETGKNPDAYRCVDGYYRSVLEGYCLAPGAKRPEPRKEGPPVRSEEGSEGSWEDGQFTVWGPCSLLRDNALDLAELHATQKAIEWWRKNTPQGQACNSDTVRTFFLDIYSPNLANPYQCENGGYQFLMKFRILLPEQFFCVDENNQK